MPAKMNSPAAYLAKLKEPLRSEITALHEFIRKNAPTLEPFVQSGMLGYGKYHYQSASGREGDWFRIGLSPGKSAISLHFCTTDEKGKYLAEEYKQELPKANIGRSCVRFKKASDIPLPVIAKMIRETVRLHKAKQKAAGQS